MRKLLIVITILFSFLVLKTDVNAACSYTRTANLKKIASNVDVSYTYTIVDNKATFDIRFANLTNDIYLYDSQNNKIYNQNGEILLQNFADGTKYRFFIKSNDTDCKDEVLSTKYVTLPKYNRFYGDPLCEGIESYVLCQRWGSFNISSYTDYINQLRKYKASLVKEKEIETEEEKDTLAEKVVDFLLKYYIYILIAIIVLCSGIIYYLSKKDKFNF